MPKTEYKFFRLSRPSLIQKIAAGYAAMAFFTMVALVFSYLNLNAINKTAREIANKDIPIISNLIRLRVSLVAQESYARKYALLKDKAFIDLFRQRQKESLAHLSVLQTVDPSEEVGALRRLYNEYQAASEQLFGNGTGSEVQLRSSALKLLDAVDDLSVRRQEMLQAVLRRTNYQQTSALRWSILISFAGFLLALVVAPIVTYRTFAAIRELQRATHRIAAGDFDYDLRIKGRDEIADLARDFTRMAARLKVLEQLNLDASPLTRLPGNVAIERELDERLKSGAEFAFCYADLDNFKPFSDRYGYAKGSELLRVTGDIVEATVKTICGAEGFVGHVGGDDFVMVVGPEWAERVCKEVIRAFDEEVVRHYSPEDRAAGGIEGTDRYGVERFFPITTISIAVVMCGGKRYGSAVDIARAAAKAKDSAKEKPGSSYLISRQL